MPFCKQLRWDDPLGPVLLTVLLIIAMSAEFTLKVTWLTRFDLDLIQHS